MRTSLVKSQPVEVERLAAFGPCVLDESVKFGARTLVVDDFFPTLVAFGKLTQLIKYRATLSIAELWQFLIISEALTAQVYSLGRCLSALIG